MKKRKKETLLGEKRDEFAEQQERMHVEVCSGERGGVFVRCTSRQVVVLEIAVLERKVHLLFLVRSWESL